MAKEIGGVLVADNHPLCREGLTTLFARNLGLGDISEASDFGGVLTKIATRGSIGLVTIDMALPGLRNGEGLRDLRVKYPDVRLVVVAGSRDRDLVLDALGAGVHGYIPKDVPVSEMAEALRAVIAGRMYVPAFVSDLTARKECAAAQDGAANDAALTSRQFEVLNLLAAGRSNKEIARLLCIAEGTVKVHIAAAFRMLGVHNRVSAAAAMQARTFNDDPVDTYLPGILEDRRPKPILRHSIGTLRQIAYRGQG